MNPNDIMILDHPELYERFRNEYFNLNPKGDPLNAWGQLKSQSTYGSKDKNGNPITLDALIESYKEYLNFWKRSFGDKDEKYIAKDDRLSDPEDFIMFKRYSSSWQTTVTSRDNYLFGSETPDFYLSRTKGFLDASPKPKINK